jgi:hypothetical protein
MKTTMTHAIVAAQPGWFLAVLSDGDGSDRIRYEPIIAWEIQRTTSHNGLVTRFPLPITAESKNADLDCKIWGIKRPDGKFVFPVAANDGASGQKLSMLALLIEKEPLVEKVATTNGSNGDADRLQVPEVVLAPH